MKPNHASRLLIGLTGTVTLGLSECIALTGVTHAAVIPIDEPPCYMRTQDGRIVNLQSLCSRTSPQPQPTSATSQPPQRTRSPQAAPSPLNASIGSRAPSGGHADGNPDSDDGRY